MGFIRCQPGDGGDSETPSTSNAAERQHIHSRGSTEGNIKTLVTCVAVMSVFVDLMFNRIFFLIKSGADAAGRTSGTVGGSGNTTGTSATTASGGFAAGHQSIERSWTAPQFGASGGGAEPKGFFGVQSSREFPHLAGGDIKGAATVATAQKNSSNLSLRPPSMFSQYPPTYERCAVRHFVWSSLLPLFRDELEVWKFGAESRFNRRRRRRTFTYSTVEWSSQGSESESKCSATTVSWRRRSRPLSSETDFSSTRVQPGWQWRRTTNDSSGPGWSQRFSNVSSNVPSAVVSKFNAAAALLNGAVLDPVWTTWAGCPRSLRASFPSDEFTDVRRACRKLCWTAGKPTISSSLSSKWEWRNRRSVRSRCPGI